MRNIPKKLLWFTAAAAALIAITVVIFATPLKVLLISAEVATSAPAGPASPVAQGVASGRQPVSDEDIRDWTARSALAVVGTAVSNQSRLTPDGKSIHTIYRVQIQEVLKGEAPNGNVLVSMPGGMVLLKPDGTEVSEDNQLKPKDPSKKIKSIKVEGSDPKALPEGAASSKFEQPVGSPLVNGKTYLLFLVKGDDVKGKTFYRLTSLSGATQSSYEVGDANAAAALADKVRLAVQNQ